MHNPLKAQNLQNLNSHHLSNKKQSNKLKTQAKMSKNVNEKAIFLVVFHVFVKDDFSNYF
jgi:hypothetical protein